MFAKKNQEGFHWLIIFLIILILAALGFTGYKVFKKKPSNSSSANSSSNSAPAKSSTSSTSSTTETKSTITLPSATELDNIKASITSGNTAALEGYMAASVSVILAGTEAYGPQTPTQAVKDVDYVSAGTVWDFALPAATLTQYQAGYYKQYFPTTALVGKSSNNYVISFQFDSSGKISIIFMTNNSSLL